MKDVVEKLRDIFLYDDEGKMSGLPDEAADEIEWLREEVLELKNLIQATVNYTGVSVSNQDYAFHPIPAKRRE